MKDRIDRPADGTVNGIPNHVIDSLARSMLPMLRDFYDSEEGKKAFAEWKAEHAQEHKPAKKQKRDVISR